MGFIISITFYSNRVQAKIPYLHVYVKMEFMNIQVYHHELMQET